MPRLALAFFTAALGSVSLASMAHGQSGAHPLGGVARPSAAHGARSRIVGTWRLVSTRQRMIDGTTRPDPDLGPRPTGYLMYDASGRMCDVISNGDRPRWASSNAPTDAEVHALFSNMVTYCGAYEVDESNGTLIYHLEIAQSPNRVGTVRRLQFALSRDHLTLYPAPLPAGVAAWSVDWARVR